MSTAQGPGIAVRDLLGWKHQHLVFGVVFQWSCSGASFSLKSLQRWVVEAGAGFICEKKSEPKELHQYQYAKCASK